MNIKELIEEQQKLDEAMFEKAGIKQYPTDDMLLAYKVKVGEALNEWAGFKFWKTNKRVDRDALLEELADCLHFALSLEGYSYDYSYNYERYEGKNKWKYAEEEHDIEHYASWCFRDCEYLGNTIALALSMGFTRKELVDAYYKKRNINFERAKNGY